MIGAKNTLDTVLVKAPHRRETFTESELEDFARCADPEPGPCTSWTIFSISNILFVARCCIMLLNINSD